ncbi:hypothetical protein SPSIL_051610 [Sporomusa silvacetica DSM 10669]|uniref:Cyclic pyranopterin monophosphate synthase n=1 Tax=Sporomusa silvacetica DSM 10669 TaxID=1123289 RepID=A0ABZ3ITY1_9FIRM|nr:cyclic pyranopterin monophosphate synthase accessory protein [Sporomusa silvacetica DSM 10669]
MEVTHFNNDGYARMVDVSEKNDTVRVAIHHRQLFACNQLLAGNKE